jgi:hypothetical protein
MRYMITMTQPNLFQGDDGSRTKRARQVRIRGGDAVILEVLGNFNADLTNPTACEISETLEITTKEVEKALHRLYLMSLAEYRTLGSVRCWKTRGSDGT